VINIIFNIMLYFLWLSIYIQESVKQLTQVNRSVYYTKKVIGHRCNNSPSQISVIATGYHSDQTGVAKVYFRSSAKGGTHAEAVGERKRSATMPPQLASCIIYIYISVYIVTPAPPVRTVANTACCYYPAYTYYYYY